ncbi:ubiquitin carboxyl-terminal hydrolase 31 [Microcaecilia unicolor]|uniref:ubiquitinyl hydrolase 1 n=1 Tax=Microcaecilia unicolor TaxID=1415580 RepID=A0A6P7YUZ9_9AMPH|nr:ubiquitin carboxyl-terminal hydrolase 31 [Microcaecilia unicolor]
MSEVPGAPAAPLVPSAPGKEKKSLSKRLFRRTSARSLGGFMGRVLRTLSALSHLTSEPEEADSGPPAPTPAPTPAAAPPPPRPPSRDRVPGVAGLRNHGNTCFMNAVLQCLSNTELFAEYLALEQYKQQPCDAPDTTADNGLVQDRGEVTEQLSGLLRALWTLEYTPQHSREFKTVVSRNALQYCGSSQHDAQEFLLWLLDRVHEDLNYAAKRNGRPLVKPPGEADLLLEGVPSPLSGSFVQELFQAQYRSSLTCPHCQKQSNTFDPFLCISLPIPLPHTRPLFVTVVYQGKFSHCMRIGVAVPLSGTVARLREAVSAETKIPIDQIVLTEMYFDGFHRSFSDTDDLDTLHESDCIFAFETPEIFRPEGILSQRGICVNNNQNPLSQSAELLHMSPCIRKQELFNRPVARERIILLVCNRSCTGHQGKRFGQPFALLLEKGINWEVLQKEILEKLQCVLRPNVCLQVCPISLRVVSVVGITYLLPQEDHPLCHPTVERALKACGPGGPAHVKLVVEWGREMEEYLFGNMEEEYVPDSESVRHQRELHLQPQFCTLSQCFQLYTKEEQLAPDDAWRCPHCKQLQQGSIKLSLWTLPDVLIIHLKRFRQEGERRIKLQNIVKFPLLGLDMTPHVVKRSQSSWSLPSHWSPWRRPYGLGRDPEDYVYDLYAVCNHLGTMQGGHYTAYCKNSVDGLWYCFDDSDVQQLAEEEVCKQTAYILFYQRRAAIPAWSANSSVAGSTSSSLCEHWVSRLPGSKQPSIASAASSRRTSLASLSESVELTGERSEDDGGFSTRPFVRSVQRQSLTSRFSVTSPLAANENGFRPSWSLAAKLHKRSSSPSQFSMESPVTLEKIGETGDDKVSTSCFGSLRNLSSSHSETMDSTRRDRQPSGKAPLAVMEGALHSESPGKKASTNLLDPVSKRTSQLDKRSPRSDVLENGNHIPFVDQSDSTDSSPMREGQHRSVSGSLSQKGEKGTTAKGVPVIATNTRDGRVSLINQQPSRGTTISKSSRSSVGSRRSSTGPLVGQPKKETPKKQDMTKLVASQKPKQMIVPVSTVPQKTTDSGSSSAVKSRVSERGLGREASKISMGSDKASTVCNAKGVSTVRVPHPKPGEHVRSSSMASLRSQHGTSRSTLKRDSKSEDKGLSFLKSALRQKETRQSADLGKTTLLSKRAHGGSCRSVNKTTTDEKSERNRQLLGSDGPTAKVSASGKHSLLSSHKRKTSQGESTSGLKAAETTLRKFPSSMTSSTKPASKPQ